MAIGFEPIIRYSKKIFAMVHLHIML